MVVGALAWTATASSATPASHPQLFGGSLVLDDARPLTVIDLATGSVTVRLPGVYSQVGADAYANVQAVPLTTGTMLVNRQSGAFNLLRHDDYVVDTVGGGVGLGELAGATSATGYADGASAYIVRHAPQSTVSLVDMSTVEAATKSAASGTPHRVTPRGYAALTGAVPDQPGAAVVAGGDLWALVGAGADACDVVQLNPVPNGHNGLQPATRRTLPVACEQAILEHAGGTVAAEIPGQAVVFASHGAPRAINVATTADANALVPVGGLSSELWYLVKRPAGWFVAGVSAGGQVEAPKAIQGWLASSNPAPPVAAGGSLYTLDRVTTGQPRLSVLNPATGAETPLAGVPNYPAKSAVEKADFSTAEVVGVGPGGVPGAGRDNRVVFNNPQSLFAVVVFTDEPRRPVIVDKSAAVDVSPVGPGDIDAKPTGSVYPATPTAAPPAAISQQVNCANTNQKPYAPQIAGISPSAESAVVTWTYQLLDQQDCEPDSWSVHMTALGGAPQPAQSLQTVNGQNQLIFTGLRPATTYAAVVTAYINTQSTPSVPATFTTTVRGPDPPTSVHTTSDGAGNWVVSWTPCTGANCYVPADAWTVMGTACGTGYVGTPPTVQVAGDQTSVTINAATIGQLGTSLSFSVQGSTAAGLSGNPASDHTCTQAWAPPNPADLSLTAAGTASGSTVTATLQVSVIAGVAPSAAYGSNGAEFTFSVGGQTVGPTTDSRVTVTGLAPNAQYTPTVSVTPAGHPGAGVTLTGQPFSQNLSWPAMSLSVPNTPDPGADAGPVTATIGGLPAGGFVASNIVLSCGSAVAIPDTAVSGGQVTFSAPLDNIGGTCTLSLVVNSTATPNPYGVRSVTLTSGQFALGTPASPAFSLRAQCQVVTGCPLPDSYTLSGTNLPSPGAHLTITPTPSPDCAVARTAPSWTVTCADYTPPVVYATWTYLGVAPAPLPACAADCVSVGLTGPSPPPTTTTTTTPTTLPPATTATNPCQSTTSSSPPTSQPATSSTGCLQTSAEANGAGRQVLAASVSGGTGGRASIDWILTTLSVASLIGAGGAGLRRRVRVKGKS